MSGSERKLATHDDHRAIPEGERFHELLDGELVRKAEAYPATGSSARATRP